jgi:hypothetical protein
MPYLKFTLEEDFLVHQVMEGRNNLANRIFQRLVTQLPHLVSQVSSTAKS